MATSDVATTVLATNSTKNGYATVMVSESTGTRQSLAPTMVIQTDHSGLETKYKDRIDNTHYYT